MDDPFFVCDNDHIICQWCEEKSDTCPACASGKKRVKSIDAKLKGTEWNAIPMPAKEPPSKR